LSKDKTMDQLAFNAGSYRTPQPAPRQRMAGLAMVAALHAIAIYALATTTGRMPLPHLPTVLTGYTLPDDRKVDEVPPPPLPSFAPPPLVVMAPPIVELEAIPPTPNAITLPSRPDEAATTALASAAPAQAIAATHTIPEYPPVSRRLGEQGTLTLKITITEQGAVSDAKLESSSGFARLDEAAMEWVKAHWRYRPAMQRGKTVPSIVLAEVTFKLQ
jgi:protein TonB